MKSHHKSILTFVGLVSIGLLLLRPNLLIKVASALDQGRVIYFFDTEKKLVALTIDDGPHPTITPLILDLLKEKQAKATFFLVGRNIHDHPEIVIRIMNEGHEIGNHTFDHNLSLFLKTDEFEQQIDETHQLLAPFQGETKWFRPGGGLYNQRMLNTVESFGYKTVLGSVYPYDANIPERAGGTIFMQSFIARNTRPGGIIILHDGQIRTVNVLEEVVPMLSDNGYQFITLSEMQSLVSKKK